MLRNRGKAGSQAGFSLVELLVAMAITATIMTAIVALFASSISAFRRSDLAIEGHEYARMTFGALERDLRVSFTSREFGDYYTFFGTPLGMTFVGASGQRLGAADAAEDNLSRTSYVIYLGGQSPEEVAAGERGTGFYITEDPDTGESVGVFTYSLLRYSERNASDLDNFMVTLPSGEEISLEAMLRGAPLTAFPVEDFTGRSYRERVQFMRQELEAFEADLSIFQYFDQMTGEFVPLTPAAQEHFVRAKKRELWLRMLGGDPNLPRFWADRAVFEDQRPQARDYVIAENIAVLDRPDWQEFLLAEGAWDEAWEPIPTLPFLGAWPFFEYGRLDAGGELRTTPYWQAAENTMPFGFEPELFLTDAQGSPLRPRLPESVVVRLPITLQSRHQGIPDFRRVFDTAIRVPSAQTRRTWDELTGFTPMPDFYRPFTF